MRESRVTIERSDQLREGTMKRTTTAMEECERKLVAKVSKVEA